MAGISSIIDVMLHIVDQGIGWYFSFTVYLVLLELTLECDVVGRFGAPVWVVQ